MNGGGAVKKRSLLKAVSIIIIVVTAASLIVPIGGSFMLGLIGASATDSVAGKAAFAFLGVFFAVVVVLAKSAALSIAAAVVGIKFGKRPDRAVVCVALGAAMFLAQSYQLVTGVAYLYKDLPSYDEILPGIGFNELSDVLLPALGAVLSVIYLVGAILLLQKKKPDTAAGGMAPPQQYQPQQYQPQPYQPQQYQPQQYQPQPPQPQSTAGGNE